MIYRQKSKKKINKFWIAIIVILALFILSKSDSLFRGVSNNSYANVFSIRDMIFSPFSKIGNGFKNKNELSSRIDELEDELRKGEIELLTLNILKNENNDLKKILYSESYNSENKSIVSKVIQKTPLSPYDTMIIENNDLLIGDYVYYGDLILGKVEELYFKTALVKLFSYPGNIVPVVLGDNIQTEATGQSNFSFTISLPKDLEINTGNVVSYPEKNTAVLGVIQDIKTTEASSFQKIYFNFPIKFSEVNYVEIKR